MEDRLHPIQAMVYLWEPLQKWMTQHGWQAALGHNAFVYYNPRGYPVGPDFFVVNEGIERGQRSWVVWDEGGLYPSLIVELLSPSSDEKDHVKNFKIYQDIFRTPDYFIYDLRTLKLEAYHLIEGRYVRVLPDAKGLMRCASLPLKLGVTEPWLRWYTEDGLLLPINEELARAEQERAEAERERAEAERERAEAERGRAEVERARADAAEQRAAELERRLRELEGGA